MSIISKTAQDGAKVLWCHWRDSRRGAVTTLASVSLSQVHQEHSACTIGPVTVSLGIGN